MVQGIEQRAESCLVPQSLLSTGGKTLPLEGCNSCNMFLLRAFPSYVGHLVLCLLAGPVLCPAFSMGLPEQVSLGLGVLQEAVLVHGQGFYARLKIDFSQFWLTGEVR